MESPLPVETPILVPAALSEISPAFLTEQLRSRGILADESVKSIHVIDRVVGIGMTAQTSRIRIVYDRKIPKAPRTAILKIPLADDQKQQFFSKMGFYERELKFYTLLGDKITFQIPRCYASRYDPASRLGLIVIEDLGGFKQGLSPESCSPERAEIILRMLAKFHAAWWNHRELKEYHWLFRTDDERNQATHEDPQQAWNSLHQAVGDQHAAALDAIGSRVSAYLQAEAARFNGPPFTLCHGDFQTGNFYFDPYRPNAEPIVTDFQVAACSSGPGTDLAFFISTCLDLKFRQLSELRLLDAYYSALVAGGVGDYSYEAFLDDYRFGLMNNLFRLAHVTHAGLIRDMDAFQARFHRYCTLVEDHQAWKVLD
jgi:hypothetical protein